MAPLKQDSEDPHESKQPMRQFNYAPPKAPSLFRQRLEFWWYASMPILIIAAISACGLWAGYRYYQSSDEETPAQRSSKENQQEPHSADFESEFLDRYIKANFRTEMDLSEKMHVTGSYANDDGIRIFTGTFDFKGNGNFRLEFTEALDLEFSEGRLVSPVSPLFESEAKLLEAFIDAMQAPLLTFKQMKDDEPLILKPTLYMGVDAYKAEIKTSIQAIHTTLTISTKNLTVLERNNHSPVSPAQKYRYSDYRTTASIRLPYSISIKDAFGKLNRISLSNIGSESEHTANAVGL